MKQVIAIKIVKEKNTYYLSDSRGNQAQSTSPKEVFEFLLKDYDNPNCFKVTWNLYALIDVIGHIISKSAYETLIQNDRVEIELEGHIYRLFSSAGRMFAVTHKWTETIHDNFQNRYEEEINIFHLSQFFPNEFAESLPEIEVRGNALLMALDEMGFSPTKLSSSVAIYDEKLKDMYVPRMLDLDDDGLDFCDFAYPLLSREWRTVFKVGHWEKAFAFDIRSGYPSIIKDFRDTNLCRFWKGHTLQRCDFGIIKGTVNITGDYSPLVNANGDNVKGRVTDYFTTPQIGYLHYFHQGTLEAIEEARYLEFLSDDRPFAETMTELYQNREQGGIKKNFAKAVSVGIGGKFSQEYEKKFGDYYNPIYSVMMTSAMSLKVGKFIMQNDLQDNLIDVVVDGFLSDKLVPVEDNKVMGDWRVEEVKALILSLGCRYITDLGETNKKDSHLNDYSSMIEAIKQHPQKSFYNGVLINKGVMETRRSFKKFPKTGRDLLNNVYNSEPIQV